MAKKKIPHAIKEYLERQIVRGSAGYEPVEAVLAGCREENLRGFLEFYEEKVRDGLLDELAEKDAEVDVFSLHGKLLKEDQDRENSQENKLEGLFRKLAKE
jgi:hypothetical protein